jgi:ribosome biogenesis GTPase
MSLTTFGWNARLESSFESYRSPGLEPARIGRADRDLYLAHLERGPLRATVAGRFRHVAQGPADFPAVGDWVAVEAPAGADQAVIQALLPRATCFSRKVAGETTEEQVLAANVDVAFLVSGLDGDFNPRRIERYLVAVWESGARPVVVLNKADGCEALAERVAEAEAACAGVPVHAVSAVTGAGLEALGPYLEAGRTVALLGSSGVGKSTLVNSLLGGARQVTGAVRASDHRGRHTTSARELIPLPRGAVLVDTPGLRELQLWGEGGAEGSPAFAELEGLAARCRFRDCRHRSEPGCAVQEALADGTLAPERYESWQKLRREQEHFAARFDERLRREREARWRSIAKQLRKRPDKRH